MEEGAMISLLPIDRLSRGIYQPRRQFDPMALQELAESIKHLGLIQPITVRQKPNGDYEIVAGERRWRAAQLAGLSEISCVIMLYTDEEAAKATTIENLQREDLNPIEEAQAYQRLADEFNYSHEGIAKTLGKSRTKVSNSMRLLSLDARVQKLLVDKQLSEGHGKILVNLVPSLQFKLAEKCAIQGWSVRKLEQEIKKMQTPNAIPPPDPNLARLEQSLSAELAAEVKFEPEPTGSGWVKIRYYDFETLEGILQKIIDYQKET